MNQQYTFAKFLLERGANPNLLDVKGRGALYAAIDIRNEDYSALPSRKENDPLPSLEIVKALLAHGANPNAQIDQESARHGAVWIPAISRLDEGTTPLMRAARAGDAAVMRILLDKGADPKLTTKDGSTRFPVRRRRRLSRQEHARIGKRGAGSAEGGARSRARYQPGQRQGRDGAARRGHCEAPIPSFSSWWSMARSWTPKPSRASRRWTSPWERTVSRPCPFRTTAPSR